MDDVSNCRIWVDDVFIVCKCGLYPLGANEMR